VGKDEIIPAVKCDEAVGCCEVDARVPLIIADLIATLAVLGLAIFMAVPFSLK
jgi:hypothetical protein